jgi:restriction system protein
MGKKDALSNLILLRKQDKNPKYVALSDFDSGYYDGDWISPWSISACNLDADLMIVAQDWSSTETLESQRWSDPALKEARRRCGHDADLATNRNLKALLKRHFELEFADTFATNVFVFIKRGKISAKIPAKDLTYCAETYTLPLIEIVRPHMVLCLGQDTFNAVQRALGDPPSKLKEASLSNPHAKHSGAEIYGVPHTGSWGTWNAGKENVSAIWARLANRFGQLSQATGLIA